MDSTKYQTHPAEDSHRRTLRKKVPEKSLVKRLESESDLYRSGSEVDDYGRNTNRYVSPYTSYTEVMTKSRTQTETKEQSKGQRVDLCKPIYIARKSNNNEQTINRWDKGDEFEYLQKDSQSIDHLIVTHLRTMKTMSVQQSELEVDDETPLRLGIRDRGIVECCLIHCNIRYCYLIRRSDQDDRVFVLSVNQPDKKRETLLSHYLIRINKCNNSFYIEHENKFHHRFFSSFRSLVNDERILESIPLSTPIDPNLILYDDDMWQIEFNQLKIGETIGTGEFGEVKYGQWKRKGTVQPIDVAIKQLKLRHDISNKFAQEIQTMKLLRNRYLVSLFGVSTDPITKQKLLITEFMDDGNLKTWLINQLEMPTNTLLIEYALQICLGMSHLERRHYVHRDLACRNILLKGHHIKVADFGMTEIVEEGPHLTGKILGRIPTRWTAPEAFLTQVFTSKSDVWSFGITLIEMWTKGERPYPTIEHSPDIISKVVEGYVHERPSTCPRRYYDQIIAKCLKKNPDDRVSFEELKNIITSLISIGNTSNQTNQNVKPKINSEKVIGISIEKSKTSSESVNEQPFNSTSPTTSLYPDSQSSSYNHQTNDVYNDPNLNGRMTLPPKVFETNSNLYDSNNNNNNTKDHSVHSQSKRNKPQRQKSSAKDNNNHCLTMRL